MTRIAIEATGCDEGFPTVLEGAKKALEINKGLELILVAGKDKLFKEDSRLKEKSLDELKNTLKKELREKYSIQKEIDLELTNYTYDSENKNKNTREGSSICRAIEMHKNRKVDAVIAPGDTRGAVFYSRELLGLMPNVLSPAIPTHWPRTNVFIDSGANVECKPENMLQFAIMGKVYSENYLNVKKPLIGILTNGKERTKGNTFVKRSRILIDRLKEKGYNISDKYFEGDFIEDLDAGEVAVTDGHTGNIVLKTAESALKKSFTYIYEEIKNQNWILRTLAYIGMYRPLKKTRKELRYEEYAVAPLLGVRGNVMICHARSDAETIANAILITEKYLKCNVNSKLEEEIAKYGIL